MRRGLSVLILTAAGCGDDKAVDDSGDAPWVWSLPAGFPEPTVPDDNPMSNAKVALGRSLFYDRRLSGNQTQSCADCHDQALAFTDGKAHAVGSTGEEHRRSAMALGNVGYASALTWASDVVRTLEDQALLPMFGEHPVELGLAGMDAELLARFSEDPDSAAAFAAAYPDEPAPVNLDTLVKAIAAFERTLISGNSAYDRYWYGGDPDALSRSAQRGMELYFSEDLECFHCHGGALFSDSITHESSTFDELAFHNTGLYNLDGLGSYPSADQGLIEVSGVETDMGRFRAPSLRNVAITAPYMHDGSVASLDEVLDHYAAGGRTITEGDDAGVGSDNPYKSEFVRGFELSEQDREDVIAFLESLTDDDFLTDPEIGPVDP